MVERENLDRVRFVQINSMSGLADSIFEQIMH